MFTKDKIKDLHYVVNGTITATELQTAADGILTKYGTTAKMPGFRPGHIPLSILRQKYNATAMAEAADTLINTDLTKYLADKKVRLAGAPKADTKGWEIGKDMEYSLDFYILPTLPAIDLDKYTITKKVTTVAESEIDKAIENIRQNRATYEKQDEKHVATKGDMAVIDFKGFVGKEAFAGGEAKNHNLVLGSGAFIPGFEDQVIGHKAGDKFDVNVKFPDEYHAKDLAGKKAKFEVEIHELRKQVLPEINDDLAKVIGMDTVDKMREHIREIITNQYTDVAQREMRDELLDILADKVKLDLPENLVDQELEMAKNEHDRTNASEKWDDKKERKDAERRVKLGLILAEWGTQNKVEVTRDDLQKAIWAEAANYPDPKQVFEFYNKNQNALNMLRGMVFERKALDAMLSNVKTKDKQVKPEELLNSGK